MRAVQARTGVADSERQAFIGRFIGDVQLHLSMLGEFQGVAHQVDQHLAQTVGVHQDPVGQGAFNLQLQRQPLGFGLGREHGDDLAGQGDRRHGLGVDLHMAGFQLGEVQHVVDDRQQGAAG